MRISTSWAQQLGVNAMMDKQAKLSKTQEQISSGLKISRPSDDPAGAARVLDLEKTVAKTSQFQNNISSARSRLNIEEASLETAENLMFRAKELTIQSLTGSLTDNDKLSIKNEIDQMLENMVGLANTRNANGEYIYSGDLSTEQPFKWDGNVNRYVYQGGITERNLDIAPARQVADGDLGIDVFKTIASVSQEADITVNKGSGDVQNNQRSVFDTLQALSSALAKNFDVPKAVISGDRFVRYGVDYSAAATSFDLTGDSGGPVTVTLNGSYADLDAVVTAINATAGLSAINVQARSNGNQIEFVSTTTGQSSSVKIDANSGSFLTDFGFTPAQTGKAVNLQSTLTGSKDINFPTTYDITPATFELIAVDGSKQVINLTTAHADINALVTDISTQIAGSPIAGKIEIEAGSNPIKFHAISSGSNASVQINQVFGDFLTDAGFKSGQTEKLYDKTVNDVLTDIDAALDNFLKVRTGIGARINALDDQKAQNEKFVLDMNTTLSETQDLDYAEAISRFNLEKTALQAAQQAFSRVQNLSLFNFL